MKCQGRLFVLAAAGFLYGGDAIAQTWQEHRETAQLQLAGYDLRDSRSPVEHLKRAIKIAEVEKASPADIGDLMDRLALAENAFSHVPQKRYEELLLAALHYKEDHLGQYASELVPTLHALSDLRHHQNRTQEVFDLIARGLTIQGRRYGPKSAQAADEYVMLGNAYRALGDFGRAETTLRMAVDILRGLPNPPDQSVSDAFFSLSEALRIIGRTDEAKSLEDESFPAFTRKLEQQDVEAREIENLPRVPTGPDVGTVTAEEAAAAAAAAKSLVPGPPPPSLGPCRGSRPAPA